TTLWNNKAGYMKSYFTRFPGYFDLTDAGMIDKEGNVHILGRTDDVLNVAGHRLSAGGMEEIVSAHPKIAECAVIGQTDTLKGETPIGFIVLKRGVSPVPGVIDAIGRDLVAAVRTKVGAIACFRSIHVVDRLPKTRSGKILRRTLRAIANGQKYQVPATIEDPEVLGAIEALFAGKEVARL
ncbi:hypothetical protein HDU96_004980, partial [Phlyctochytrium bullatum]